MKKLPIRKKNRLQNYDYSQNGAYFITICTMDKRKLLWNAGDSVPSQAGTFSSRLSEYGFVVDDAIQSIPQHYHFISVSKYVIMPNHLHMILMLANDNTSAMHTQTVATVINQLKGFITKQIGFSLWQKLYHDHIIRSSSEYEKIWKYIDTNPQKWESDCFYV